MSFVDHPGSGGGHSGKRDNSSPSLEDDAMLVCALKRGTRQASEVLYDRYALHIRKVITNVLGVDDELPDLLQEVFLRALESIERLKDGAKLKGWLTSIAVFTTRETIRKRQRGRWLRFFASEDLPPVSGAAASGEITRALRAAYKILDGLPVDERIAFTLRYIEDLTVSEIAEITKVSESTAKRRLSLARNRFIKRARSQPSLVEWMGNRLK